MIPTFRGWSLNLCSTCHRRDQKDAFDTHLLPKKTKVTEFSTTQKYITYLQSFAADVNIPYVNITLDVDAVINVYKKCYYTSWNLLLSERKLSGIQVNILTIYSKFSRRKI